MQHAEVTTLVLKMKKKRWSNNHRSGHSTRVGSSSAAMLAIGNLLITTHQQYQYELFNTNWQNTRVWNMFWQCSHNIPFQSKLAHKQPICGLIFGFCPAEFDSIEFYCDKIRLNWDSLGRSHCHHLSRNWKDSCQSKCNE